MNEYTATNGVQLYGLDGSIEFEGAGVILNPARVDALREFFQAERDEALGRWRWPENPDYVVYEDREANLLHQPAVIVVNESNGGSIYSALDGYTSASGIAASDLRIDDAARAYFATHPESKPWHDARAGEVWLLTIDGQTEAYRTEMVTHLRFFAIRSENDMTYGLRSPEITSARRIYPEES